MTTHHDHSHEEADCLAMFEKLSEYIDNELDELTCKDIERHVHDCIKCNVCLETLKRTVDICRHMKTDPAPVSLSAKLKGLIRELS